MTTATLVSRTLPVLPEGWSGEKDFKLVGKVSASTQRTIEPVGPHFLAHARRARHKRTFSEDDRIQAQERVKNVEEDDDSDVSEPEDPMMLQREAKDWKVKLAPSATWWMFPSRHPHMPTHTMLTAAKTGARPLRRTRPLQVSLQGHRGPDQARPPQEGPQAPPRQEGRHRPRRGRQLLQVHPEGH